MVTETAEETKENTSASRQIRPVSVDFLLCMIEAHKEGIAIYSSVKNIGLTSGDIGVLLGIDRTSAAGILREIYRSGEISEDETCVEIRKNPLTGRTYRVKYHSFAAAAAASRRIGTVKSQDFRDLAETLSGKYMRQCTVLDKGTLRDDVQSDEDYFTHIESWIGEIRNSDRRFYQKITDLYSTASDYSPTAYTTEEFYAALLFRLSRTCSAVEYDTSDVLNEILAIYLNYAACQARQHLPMTMSDWAYAFYAFLKFRDDEIMQDRGRLLTAAAQALKKLTDEKKFES